MMDCYTGQVEGGGGGGLEEKEGKKVKRALQLPVTASETKYQAFIGREVNDLYLGGSKALSR